MLKPFADFLMTVLLSLIPLLLELSNSSEEFFKSSRVSTMKESKGNLDLEILKNWAKTDAFEKLIHDFAFLDEGYGNIGCEEFRRGNTKIDNFLAKR